MSSQSPQWPVAHWLRQSVRSPLLAPVACPAARALKADWRNQAGAGPWTGAPEGWEEALCEGACKQKKISDRICHMHAPTRQSGPSGGAEFVELQSKQGRALHSSRLDFSNVAHRLQRSPEHVCPQRWALNKVGHLILCYTNKVEAPISQHLECRTSIWSRQSAVYNVRSFGDVTPSEIQLSMLQ